MHKTGISSWQPQPGAATCPILRQPSPAAKPDPERPRLRGSCDGCQDAKLRCSRDRPTCARCTRLDVPCMYSAIRRVGRPPKSATGQSATMNNNNSDASNAQQARRSNNGTNHKSSGSQQQSPYSATAPTMHQYAFPPDDAANTADMFQFDAYMFGMQDWNDSPYTGINSAHDALSQPPISFGDELFDLSAPQSRHGSSSTSDGTNDHQQLSQHEFDSYRTMPNAVSEPNSYAQPPTNIAASSNSKQLQPQTEIALLGHLEHLATNLRHYLASRTSASSSSASTVTSTSEIASSISSLSPSMFHSSIASSSPPDSSANQSSGASLLSRKCPGPCLGLIFSQLALLAEEDPDAVLSMDVMISTEKALASIRQAVRSCSKCQDNPILMLLVSVLIERTVSLFETICQPRQSPESCDMDSEMLEWDMDNSSAMNTGGERGRKSSTITSRTSLRKDGHHHHHHHHPHQDQRASLSLASSNNILSTRYRLTRTAKFILELQDMIDRGDGMANDCNSAAARAILSNAYRRTEVLRGKV